MECSAPVIERRQLQSWERFAALLAAAVALVLNIAATVELFAPQSTFGYRLIYTSGFEVAAVDADTSAARAGIATGDHFDFSKSTLHDRIVGLAYQPALRADAVTFLVLHEKRPRSVTLRAGPLTASESRQALFSPLASVLRLAGFAYIAVALVILLRRPTRMTWGLFLYLVSATDVTLYRFPEGLVPIATFASDLLSVAGTVGLVIFAVRFPNDRPLGWRAQIDRLAIPIGALFAIPNLAWDATSLFWGESPAAWMSYGSTLGALALILIAGATLIATYAAAQRWERQRLQWVMAGVFFTLLSYAMGWARYWSIAYPLATSNAVVWAATLFYAMAPFAIAYAVVRQRVFEVSFVVSRTLIYTIMTGTIFSFFALIEWLVSHVIERSGAAIVLVALAAIGMAFSLDRVHGKIEDFVERTLFRRRHQAEQHLADVAAGLPAARNVAAVEEALLREPMQAYALGSAALFSRDGSGDFVHDGNALDRGVALRLQGIHRAVRLHEFHNGGAEIESTDPVLAVPVFVRSRLESVVVYGAHANGEDIDPDEAASLEAVGVAAGIAYEHLESARTKRELDRWRRLVERQARELAALRERVAALGEPTAGNDPRGPGMFRSPP
jgi:hypothetical protein